MANVVTLLSPLQAAATRVAGKLRNFKEGFRKSEQVENAKAEFVAASLKLQQQTKTIVAATEGVMGNTVKLTNYLQAKLGNAV